MRSTNLHLREVSKFSLDIPIQYAIDFYSFNSSDIKSENLFVIKGRYVSEDTFAIRKTAQSTYAENVI